MKLLRATLAAVLALSSTVHAVRSWTFDDATVQVATRGSESEKQKLTAGSSLPASSPVALLASSTLKIILTAREDNTAKRPHQAFLTLQDPDTGLEDSYAFSMKDNGKGKLELTPKDLPFQFLTSSKSIKAFIVLASFGSTAPYKSHVFDLSLANDSKTPISIPPAPERYAAKPEIHHIFKADPRSPPIIVSLLFTVAILASLPALIGVWLFLGGNIGHMSKAFGTSPAAHALFLGSIIAMEGVFLLYYLSWNLFQTLPVAVVVSTVAYVSGSKALTEVQERRLVGES